MKSNDLKKRLQEVSDGIESAAIFDGRGRGVDVYVCDKCGAKFYTRYKDKGVTPFVIKCRACEKSHAVHKDTISEHMAGIIGVEVHNWIRPTFEQLQKLSEGEINHVLDGGLILEGLETQSEKQHEFIDDFITVGELRKMLEPFDDGVLITVTRGNAHPNHRITHIEDSVDCGFWELRIEEGH